jgi:hypothetical protein
MVLEEEVGNHDHSNNHKKVKKEEEAASVDNKAKLQQIIDRIPIDKIELFKFVIDWNIVDEVCEYFYISF